MDAGAAFAKFECDGEARGAERAAKLPTAWGIWIEPRSASRLEVEMMGELGEGVEEVVVDVGDVGPDDGTDAEFVGLRTRRDTAQSR